MATQPPPISPEQIEYKNRFKRASEYEDMFAERIDTLYQMTLGTQLQDVFSKLLELVSQPDGGAYGPGGPQYGLTYISSFFRDLMPESVFSHASPTGLAASMAPPPPGVGALDEDVEEGLEAGGPVYTSLDTRSFSNTYNQTYKLVPGWRMAVAAYTAQTILVSRTQNRQTTTSAEVDWPLGARLLDDADLTFMSRNNPSGDPDANLITNSAANRQARSIAAYLSTPLGFAIMFARLTQGYVVQNTTYNLRIVEKKRAEAQDAYDKGDTAANKSALDDATKAEYDARLLVLGEFHKGLHARVTEAASKLADAEAAYARSADPATEAARIAAREEDALAISAMDAYFDMGPFALMYEFYELNRAKHAYPIALFGNEFIDDVLVARAIGYTAEEIATQIKEAYRDITSLDNIVPPHIAVPASVTRPFVWAVLGGGTSKASTDPAGAFIAKYIPAMMVLPKHEPWITHLHDVLGSRPRVRLHCPLPFIGGTESGPPQVHVYLPVWNFVVETMLQGGKDTGVTGNALFTDASAFRNYLAALQWENRIDAWVATTVATYDAEWQADRKRVKSDAASTFPYDSLGLRSMPRTSAKAYVARTAGMTVVPQFVTATRPNSYVIAVNSSVRMWLPNYAGLWDNTKPGANEASKKIALEIAMANVDSIWYRRLDAAVAAGARPATLLRTAAIVWWTPPIVFNKAASETVYSNAIFAAPCRDDVIMWRRISSYLLRVIDSDKLVATIRQAKFLVEGDSGIDNITVWELASGDPSIPVLFSALVSKLTAAEIASTSVRGSLDAIGVQAHTQWSYELRSKLQYTRRVYLDEENDPGDTRLELYVPASNERGGRYGPALLPPKFLPPHPGTKRSSTHVRVEDEEGVYGVGRAPKRRAYGSSRYVFV